MIQEFNSFSELKQLLPKAKEKRKKEFIPDTKYTKTNDTDFARFARFEKLAKNQQIKLKKKITKEEAKDLEEEII